MKLLFWGIGIVAAAALIALIAAYICYRKAFQVNKKRLPDPYELLPGEQYEVYRKETHALLDQTLPLPYEDVSILSREGLRLHARYYGFFPGAPVQIMFHGYRSVAQRDFCGALLLARECGHNALVVDQRAHGESEGRCLTFGILERYDCRDWANYAAERFGTKILLVGVSMGAATVLMAAALDLPEQVAGIIADCGYTSPKEIICKVMREMHFPEGLVYPAVALGARLFAGFHPEETTATEAMRSCRLPMLMFHGEDDRYVPCEMSRVNFAACASPEKQLLTFPGAGHGLSMMVDRERYVAALRDFYRKIL